MKLKGNSEKQRVTQKNPLIKQAFILKLQRRAGGSAWLERSADNRKVESSNLSRPTKLNFQNKAIFAGISENKVKFT